MLRRVGLAYRSRGHEETLATGQEFQATYDAPVGLLLAGDSVSGEEPVEEIAEGVVQLPYRLSLRVC